MFDFQSLLLDNGYDIELQTSTNILRAILYWIRNFISPNQSNLQLNLNLIDKGEDRRWMVVKHRTYYNCCEMDAERAYDHYLDLLNEDGSGNARDPKRRGLARELGRMNLSLNYYTQWYWKIDLHNLMHFIQLRIDPHAQYEIRAYADVLYNIMQRWVPITASAFEEYRLGALTLSASAVRAVRERIAGKNVTAGSSGVTTREWK